MKLYKVLIFIYVFVITGCATVGRQKINVSVDSSASSYASEKKTYLLFPGEEGVTWNDPQFREYAAYLIRALNAQGYVAAKDVKEANVAVYLSYGMGDPQKHQTNYSVESEGKRCMMPTSTRGENTTITGTSNSTSSYGVAGSQQFTRTYTTYLKYALITGYDLEHLRETNEQLQLWRTSVTSSGSSNELKRVLPILIAAAAPYLAGNTGRKISRTLDETDPAVKAVKGLSLEQE